MSYYGSNLADRAVRAYASWCRRSGVIYDEPGQAGVELLRGAAGHEVVEISNQYGVVFRAVEQQDGRLRCRPT